MASATFDFPTITSIGSGIAALIAVATILLKGGRILQKVDSLEERFKGFEKKLDGIQRASAINYSTAARAALDLY